MRKYLFILPFLFFLFSSFSVSDSHAVADISQTYTSGTEVSSWRDIFTSCSGSCFHDFSYLVVQSSSSIYDDSNMSSLSPFRIYARMNGSQNRTFYFSQNIPFQVYNLSFNDSDANYLQWGNGTTLLFDLTFTLTNNPFPGITPSGSLSVTENGTYDVTDYAEVVVDIPATDCPPSSGGNYHDDLMKIYNAIILCSGTVLVLYFFYCIYRMFIKSTWGKQ